MDEMFESLTLIQTDRMAPVPFLLFGKEFWKNVFNLDELAAQGTISPEDTELFTAVDSAEEGWSKISEHYDIPN